MCADGPGPASISPVGNIDVGQRLQITCSATPTGQAMCVCVGRGGGSVCACVSVCVC